MHLYVCFVWDAAMNGGLFIFILFFLIQGGSAELMSPFINDALIP